MTVMHKLQAAPAAEVPHKGHPARLVRTNTENIFAALKPRFLEWDYSRLSAFLGHLVALAKQDALMEKQSPSCRSSSTGAILQAT